MTASAYNDATLWAYDWHTPLSHPDQVLDEAAQHGVVEVVGSAVEAVGGSQRTGREGAERRDHAGERGRRRSTLSRS